MTKNKTTKNAAGDYTRTDGVNSVHVRSDDYGYGLEWVAVAGWDERFSSDPVATKWEAVEVADWMLKERRGQ